MNLESQNRIIRESMSVMCRKPRVAGSRYDASMHGYLRDKCRELGYSVTSQSMPFVGWELLEKPEVRILSPEDQLVKYCLPLVGSGSTDGIAKGILISAGTITTNGGALKWERYAIRDEYAGIVAYLIVSPDKMVYQPLEDWSGKEPYIMVDNDAYRKIQKSIHGKNETIVSASIKSRYIPNLSLRNILVQKSNNICPILVSCHYDSFIGTLGAHDNASGTVAVLALADAFQQKEFDNVGMRFFDAEEWNQLGSQYYVAKRLEKKTLDEVKLLVNIDSVGIGDQIQISASPLVANIIERIVSRLEVSREVGIIVKARSTFPGYDSWPFMKQGIPVIQIGTVGSDIYKYFHTADDIPDIINYSRINQVVELVKGLINEYQVY